MKLHRDGSHFAHVTPFEIEMRRRLWWQICFIDAKAEDMQVSEYKLTERIFDTGTPVNSDDVNLDPGMSKPPIVTEGWTDMTVFLIRCEVWKLSRRLQSFKATSYYLPHDIDEKLELLQQTKARIEVNYLKYLNPNQPLHSFVGTMTRLFLTKVDLILHFKQHSIRATESQHAQTIQTDKIFMSLLLIIEYTYALLNEPGWSSWKWQIQGQLPPWHALRIVLSHLHLRGWEPIYERAWSSAKMSLDNLSEADRRDPRYQQLLSLATAVQDDRAKKHDKQNVGAPTDTNGDLESTDLTLSPLEECGIGDIPAWMPEEPFLAAPNNSNNNFSDTLDLEMDWEGWNDITGDLEPSLDLWGIGGF